MNIIPELEWEKLLKTLIKHKGTAILLGATDSGKSSLAEYLIGRLVAENIKTALVDSDIGQSSLGLPGTISMKIFCNQNDVDNFRFEKMSFIGSTNPAKNIHLMIEKTTIMAGICRGLSEIVLIDTTGLISGELGRALKIGKIRAIRPDHIIAVQRGDELEHILSLIKNIHIHRITASRMARVRSRGFRIRYRKKRFDDYFDIAGLTEYLLNLNDVGSFYNGKPFRPRDRDFNYGTLIGLNHNDDTIALGILVEISCNSITIRSPIKSIRDINRVVFGDIVI
jgi:polynucleotide 5'-hydroxyl-kinase GRC3/NOL9